MVNNYIKIEEIAEIAEIAENNLSTTSTGHLTKDFRQQVNENKNGEYHIFKCYFLQIMIKF